MIVVLDNLRSAFNVGSIIRTCDALGINEMYFCGITPGIKNSKVKKTSLGAEINIQAHEEITTIEAVKLLKNMGGRIYCLEVHKDSVPITQAKASENDVLVVGNEVSGISEDVLMEADKILSIPMRGIKESLNVSIAFGIAAFELIKV